MTAGEFGDVANSAVLVQVIERAADPELWARFSAQLKSTAGCRQPVRLRGQVDAIDFATGERRSVYSTRSEPDETLLKCCGNRREAVCPPCAETYRADAYQLVAAGMRGGKGVPDTVTEHPMVFVTLTAPSFGAVHSRRAVDGRPQRCRPRRNAPVCPHGKRLSCSAVHAEDDPCLGEPLCPDCFDYEHAVLWNAMVPELWRRTAIQIPRELARTFGLTQKELRRRVRVSYVKVAEYQARGALHFHCVIRLDQAQPRATAELVQAPSSEFDVDCLADAVRAAARHVSVTSPAREDGTGAREIRWGRELEIRPLDLGGSAQEASACAAYIAKYATKSTEAVGGLTTRITAAQLNTLRVRPHVRRYLQATWRLGGEQHLHGLRLRRWAHTLGFRGHCFTKSRRYSTTFTTLRRARHEHELQRAHPNGRTDPWGRPVSDGASDEVRRFQFAGRGYRTAGDAWLADSTATRAREERRIAREELHATYAARKQSPERLEVAA